MSVVAKVTSRCDLKCKHCPWWGLDTEDAGTEEWLEALRFARNKGAIHLVLEGGEPTCRDDLDELISYAKELGMLVVMATNGLRDLGKFDADIYWISFEGIGEIHDENRGTGVFDRVVSNIKRNQDKSVISLVSLNSNNAYQLDAMASFFPSITNGVWFNFTYPYRGVEHMALPPGKAKEIARQIIELKREFNILNSDSFLRSVGDPKKDCTPYVTLLVDSDLSTHQGCTVEQLEECRCDICGLACYGEVSQAMRFRYDAGKTLFSLFGVVKGSRG